MRRPESSVSGVRLSELVMTPHFTEAGAWSLWFVWTGMDAEEKPAEDKRFAQRVNLV